MTESEKETKEIIDENNLGSFSKPYVDKKMHIADPNEDIYYSSKTKISKILVLQL